MLAWTEIGLDVFMWVCGAIAGYFLSLAAAERRITKNLEEFGKYTKEMDEITIETITRSMECGADKERGQFLIDEIRGLDTVYHRYMKANPN